MKEDLEIWHLVVGLASVFAVFSWWIASVSAKVATEKTLQDAKITACELQIHSVKDKQSRQDTDDKESKALLHAIQMQLQAITTTLIERDKAAEAMNKVIDYITHKQEK